MALKDTWVDKKNTTDGNDGDYIVAEDINAIANAVIDLEEHNDNKEFYTKDETDAAIKAGDDALAEQFGSRIEDLANGFDEVLSNFYNKNETDEKLKNPSYEEDVSLVGITTEVGDIGATITDNAVAGAGNLFHVNITGHIKFHCEVDKGGGRATVMDVELGGDTGVYEYSFEGVVEDGFEVYCSFAGVTFTEFVKKVYVKDAIGDIDSALDELHTYAQALIGGDA